MYPLEEKAAPLKDGERRPGPPVTVRTKDGRKYTNRVYIVKGSPQNPLTTEEIVTKFKSMASLVLPEEKVNKVPKMVGKLEKLENINELVRLLIS